MSQFLEFLRYFTEERNFCDFLFASLDDETLSKWDLLLWERNLHQEKYRIRPN